MSTLRTDTLQTTDSTVTIQVSDLAGLSYLNSTYALPVDNIASLKAVSKLLFNKVIVSGYYTKGDGGGFEYYLDPVDTTSADNKGTIIVAADGGRWKAKIEGNVTTRHFGAKVDGIAGTDDSSSIQSALTWCAANNRSLHFATGTSRLLSALTIPSNSDLVGEGESSIFLDPNMTLGASIGGSARAVYSSIASNISLSKIRFYSLKTGLTKAITVCFNSIDGLRIEDCTFEDFGNATYYAQGAIVFDSSDIHIVNNKFNNNSGDGFALSSGSTDFTIVGNEFTQNSDWGCALVIGCNHGSVSYNIFKDNTSSATGVDRCQHVQFVGNSMDNNEHGIRVAEFGVSPEKNSHITIANNNISGVAVAGISVELMKAAYGQYTLIGNTIEGSSGHGILVSDSELGTIVGNAIYSCAGDGILFQSFNAGRVTGGATVIGNKIQAVVNGIRQIAGPGTTASITVMGNETGALSGSAQVLLGNSSYIESSNLSYFDVSKAFNFPSAIQSNTATAGGTTPPAQVQGYLPIYMGGILRKVPFYNT